MLRHDILMPPAFSCCHYFLMSLRFIYTLFHTSDYCCIAMLWLRHDAERADYAIYFHYAMRHWLIRCMITMMPLAIFICYFSNIFILISFSLLMPTFTPLIRHWCHLLFVSDITISILVYFIYISLHWLHCHLLTLYRLMMIAGCSDGIPSSFTLLRHCHYAIYYYARHYWCCII